MSTTEGQITIDTQGTAKNVKNLKLILNNVDLGDINIQPTETPIDWNFPITLKPGSYTLKVIGTSESNRVTTTTRRFSVLPKPSQISLSYDGEGNLSKQVITKTADNTTRTQELTWDAWNRLVKVTERDNENNGYDWSAVYDGFGRRLKTLHTPVIAGTLQTEKTQTVSSFYDPEVEFLEIGVKVNDKPTTWKVYGPDKSGIYGGLQGLGGLEAIITPDKTYRVINNALGHAVATHDESTIKLVPTEVGAYGPLPGNLVLSLNVDRELQDILNWQGRRIDETGFYWMGDNYYDYERGVWIKPDPYGHWVNWSLYSFCNNNPVTYTDPTGRLATQITYGAVAVAKPIVGALEAATGYRFLGHRPFNASQRVVALTSAGMSALPIGVVARGFGAGAQSVRALTTGPAFGGTLYPSQKLQQLTGYLGRRGIQVMETGGNPAFIARADGTATMLLPNNPTALQVKHELSHYLDFRNSGFDAYRNLGRAGREMSVLERLQANRVWDTMNESERAFSINYATEIK